MLAIPGGENQLVTSWAWTCAHGIPAFCRGHEAGLSPVALVAFTAFTLMMLWTRDLGQRPPGCLACSGRLRHRRDCPNR